MTGGLFMPYAETTSDSWFGRIGNSFAGIAAAIILLAAATYLLYWNEGRTVRTGGAINEAQLACVEMKDISKVDPALDGKLVHAVGKADTKEILEDETFGIKTPGPAIKLARSTEYYQWVESAKSEKRKKLGGGEETVTTYTYTKKWSTKMVDSSKFHDPEYVGKNKYITRVDDKTFVAKNVTLGAYELPDFLKNSITRTQPLAIDVSQDRIDQLNKLIIKNLDSAEKTNNANYRTMTPRSLFGDTQLVHIDGNTVYIGLNFGRLTGFNNPDIGDMRIKYVYTPPQDVSLIAKVLDDTFEEFFASNGAAFSKLSVGTKSAVNMFADARKSNKMTAWLLRIIGAVLVISAFGMLFAPLSVIADVIPMLGSIVGAGTGLVAFLLGLAWSFIVIAVSWVRFRPMLAFSLIGAAVVAVVLLFAAGHRKRAAA
jgi:hypothetical protein